VAQAGTLPITIMLFNRFPTYFIITNIMIVPLASLLIITACLIPLFYPIRFLSGILSEVLNHITGFTINLTNRIAQLPGSTIENIGMTTFECILLTIIIFLFCTARIKRHNIPVNYLLLMVLAILMAGVYKDISLKRSNELIVYNNYGSSVVGVSTGKIINIFSSTGDVTPEVERHSSTLGLRINESFNDKMNFCISAGGKKIVVTTILNKEIISDINPDIIIITGPKPEITGWNGPGEYPGKIIITSETSPWYRLPGNAPFHHSDSVHYTRRSGAFRVSL
jgi:hypothetical protein